jgi:hypothetical protein
MFRNPFRKKNTEFSGGLRWGQLVRPSMNLKNYDRMRKINRLLGRIELTKSTGLMPMKQEYWIYSIS